MKVTGFSFIRNAIQYAYPVKEAYQSILPLCDDMVVAAGDSEDDTRELVASIAPAKIRIIDTVWNNELNEGGKVLADETNKAFHAINEDTDWCFYIQGDEVLHEQGYDEIYQAMQRYKNDTAVDGLLFRYHHFYGSFDYIGSSSRWYRNEIRIIKNDKRIYSYRDAQGFRKNNNEKLKVKPLNAFIHHYGYVREPEAMQAKSSNFGRFWAGNNWNEAVRKEYSGPFNYNQIDALSRFEGSHPRVMQERIEKMNWNFSYDLSYNKLKLKDRFKNAIEKLTGARPFDYTNYTILK